MIRRYDGGWAEDRLNTYGALAGGPLMQAGFLANEHKPQFKTHDRYGNRIDLVEFHPAYHELDAHGHRARPAVAALDRPAPAPASCVPASPTCTARPRPPAAAR